MRGNLFGLGGREPASGASSCTTGEVRRLKVTDDLATCVLVCVGGRGVPGFDDADGEKPLMAYKPDKALPESGGGAREA